MITTLYRLRPPPAPWGDYGRILAQGMSMHVARQDGCIRLERTGPFMPPMTFPGAGDIVVKAWLRERLQQTGLTGLAFAPVVKHHIARLDWHVWDRDAKEPSEFPESNEPEHYILSRPHSDAASRMIGDLFELCPAEVAVIDRTSGFSVVRGSWGEADLFRGHGAKVTFATRRARHWLEANVGEHVAFEDVAIV